MASDIASNLPLNVAARGEEVIILGSDRELVLTVEAARKSAQRLLDAVAVAQGRLPAAAIDAAG